jgi:ZIP family zinc transporter
MLALVALAAFCATFFGGLLAWQLRDSSHLVLGFSAGAVIGVAFFDLLPESLSLTGFEPHATFGFVALGFALYLVLDRIFVLHHHHEPDAAGHAHTHALAARGQWGAGTLSIHSFLDGLGIGVAFQASPEIGFAVAAAVLAHGFSDGINTVSMVGHGAGGRERALRWLTTDALAPVFGIAVGGFITLSDSALGIMLALFSGFFLYLGASELLPESHHEHPVWLTTAATVFGLAAMYLLVGALRL